VNGERLGVLPITEALTAARERDLDLVEVAPSAAPPVCRILDYGKYKYEQAKKDRDAAKHSHHGELREVRFKVKIGDHDMDMKVRRAERFLREGSKVKVSVMFRGREIVHPEIGRELLTKVQQRLGEWAIIDKQPTMEGRFMNMYLAPGKVRPATKAPAGEKAREGDTAPEGEAAPREEAPAVAEG